VPDHTTLWWFARHRLTPVRQAEALRQTVRLVAREHEVPRQVALGTLARTTRPGKDVPGPRSTAGCRLSGLLHEYSRCAA
jgi:hypothetical protein